MLENYRNYFSLFGAGIKVIDLEEKKKRTKVFLSEASHKCKMHYRNKHKKRHFVLHLGIKENSQAENKAEWSLKPVNMSSTS